ncbi:AAA family ATPase [Arcobacter sp. 15-2]|uniref:AAA family ATPase n=1 Tax=Arcobacter sp. 15-2 TaxID=3374109 RepID=UPI00399CB6D7
MIKHRKNIKISRVTINGFQSNNRMLDLELANGNISIIYGENGSGKTTFLKIMNAILKQDSSTLYNKNISKIKIIYKVDEEKKVVNIKINENFDELEENNFRYLWTEFNSSELADTYSLSFGIERGVVSSSLKIDTRDILDFLRHPRYRKPFINTQLDMREFAESMTEFLKRTNIRRANRYAKRDELSIKDRHAYLQNIKMTNIEDLLQERYIRARNIATEQIQSALFDTLTFVFEKTDNNNANQTFAMDGEFIDSLFNNKDRLIEALDDGVDENTFKQNMINKLEQIKEKKDIIELINNEILYTLIKNMIKELEVEKLLLSAINTFVEHFNKFLSDNKKLVINYDSINVEIDNVPYNLDILSSGERHIFTFLSLIIIEGSYRDFIFIDEPEISLNIKWQRILMTLLNELAPNTQIIVASHSPLIAKKTPNALVELLIERV